MPAPQRFSLEAISQALEQTRGNATAAAELLGMSRNNLLRRIEASGRSLNEWRGPAARHQSARMMRVKTERFEALRQAGFDLAYRRREECGPERVLDELLAEAFDGWLKAKLAAAVRS